MGGDSNPRNLLQFHTLSRRAQSTTLSPILLSADARTPVEGIFRRFSARCQQNSSVRNRSSRGRANRPPRSSAPPPARPWASDATPTAARACRPASPNTATSKSDAPLITCGTSVKSGVTLTNPLTITTCFQLVQRANGRLDDGQQVQRADSRRFLRLRERFCPPRLARDEGAVGLDRNRAGQKQQVTRPAEGQIIPRPHRAEAAACGRGRGASPRSGSCVMEHLELPTSR